MRLIFSLIIIFINLLSANIAFARPLTLILDWHVNPNHAPIFVAQQQGFFEQQGIKVNIIPPSDPNDGPKLVAAGQADIALDYQPHLLLQVAHGLPLKQVGTLVNQPLNCLVTLKRNHINSINNLRGKLIGYSTAGVDSIMLKIVLQHAGLALSDVRLINVRYGLVQALLANRIDAFTGGMRNVEPVQVRRLGKIPHIFYPEKYGFPNYAELVFVAHSDSRDDAKIKKFLLAVKQGVAFLKKHPNKSWKLFSQHHPELNNDLTKTIWFNTIDYFYPFPEKVNQKQLDSLRQFLQKQTTLLHSCNVSRHL